MTASHFVDVTGKLGLALGGAGLFLGGVFGFVLVWFSFQVGHGYPFILGAFALAAAVPSGALLAASYGFHKRRPWGRRAMLAFLAGAALLEVPAGVGLARFILHSGPALAFAPVFWSIVAAIAAAFGLTVWLAAKLLDAEIKREFP